MTKKLRVKTSKFIDETYKISFRFNGKTYYGYKGGYIFMDVENGLMS